MIDIKPAANRMTSLLTNLSEGQFDLPTPCPDARVGELVDHVGAFAKGFIAVANKDRSGTGPPGPPNIESLEAGWRERIARDLAALADAWLDPGAWEGMTSAGGIELPGEVAGLVALDELVVHAWDISVAIGQPYAPPVEDVEGAMAFVGSFGAPRDGRLFGPIVPVPDNAAPLDRLLGLTGRDPNWQPPAR